MDWKRSVSALAIGAISLAAQAQSLSPEQERFHGIYKELVETNTTHSAGDTTLAAQRMARHLRDAGFAEADLQILEPFPRKGNLVARFRGDGSKKPLLLLAHLDVVEALRADWKTDPFVLQESDGFFTARGSIDDKSMAAAFVSILSQLKREGFRPKRDIILALTADEERGDVPSNGVYWLVNNKRELLEAEFGINEGGGGELAQDMRAVASGHADAQAYDRLSSSALYNALLRTTCVATMLRAGHAENALPQSATATVNCRILPHDDAAAVDAEVRRLADPKVEVKETNAPLASPPSPLRADLMKLVEGLTQEMFPGVPVVPSMSTGATDSRFLR